MDKNRGHGVRRKSTLGHVTEGRHYVKRPQLSTREGEVGKNLVLVKALVVKNSALHDFGFGKVSQIHKTFLMELQLFGWRHFSKTEVVQNTVLNH